MTTPLWCLFFAFLLITVSYAPSAIARARMPGGYDNRHPRTQQTKLEGWGARALAAHQNVQESFAGFAAAVIVHHVAGGDPWKGTVLAITWLVARGVYLAFYLADLDYLRSAVWGVAWLCTIGLFLLPALT
jgi:uncharacterized MAPEG superfamily protein